MKFHFKLSPSKTGMILVLGFLLLPAMACGLVNPQYRLKNDVRLAVYAYERRVRGPVDDLVIYFNRDEPRIKFEGQYESGGRTVWLYNFGVTDYFAVRSPQDTYLFIQTVDFGDDHQTATATVYRGGGNGNAGRQLKLSMKPDETWTVTAEVIIPNNASIGTD